MQHLSKCNLNVYRGTAAETRTFLVTWPTHIAGMCVCVCLWSVRRIDHSLTVSQDFRQRHGGFAFLGEMMLEQMISYS